MTQVMLIGGEARRIRTRRRIDAERVFKARRTPRIIALGRLLEDARIPIHELPTERVE